MNMHLKTFRVVLKLLEYILVERRIFMHRRNLNTGPYGQCKNVFAWYIELPCQFKKILSSQKKCYFDFKKFGSIEFFFKIDKVTQYT